MNQMNRFISNKTEFYLGLITTVGVAFLMPMLVTMEALNSWAFLGYLYLLPGIGVILHALYPTLHPEEKESILPGIAGRILRSKEKETA